MGEFVKVASADEVAPGQARLVSIKGKEIALFEVAALIQRRPRSLALPASNNAPVAPPASRLSFFDLFWTRSGCSLLLVKRGWRSLGQGGLRAGASPVPLRGTSDGRETVTTN
jgi:hypothetical protein